MKFNCYQEENTINKRIIRHITSYGLSIGVKKKIKASPQCRQRTIYQQINKYRTLLKQYKICDKP